VLLEDRNDVERKSRLGHFGKIEIEAGLEADESELAAIRTSIWVPSGGTARPLRALMLRPHRINNIGSIGALGVVGQFSRSESTVISARYCATRS
jgi:hypothetical protein